jgi:DNA polymerase-3 subunit beta
MRTQTFARAINIANQCVERRGTIPILASIRMTARPEGKVRLSATDMDRQVDVDFDGEINADVMLPMAGSIAKALGAFAAAETTVVPLPPDRQGISIVSGDFNIELDTLPVSDFPTGQDAMQVDHTAEVNGDFIKALRQVAGAVSTEETRYYLNGVYIHRVAEPWSFAVVATDGHRMYIRDVQIPGFAPNDALPNFEPFIIPRRLLDLLLALADKKAGDAPVTLSVGREVRSNTPSGELQFGRQAGLVRFSFKIGDNDVTLTGRTIDGSFPDYRRVIPKDTPLQATFKTADLRRAVQALAVGCEKKGSRALEIVLLRDLAKITTRWDHGAGKAVLQVPYEGNVFGGKCNQVGINARYLLDALNTVNGAEEFRFGFSPEGMPTDPMILTAKGMDDFKAVLMPMRV